MKKQLLFLWISLLSVTAAAQDTEFWFAPSVQYTPSPYRGHGGFMFTNPGNRQATVNIEYYKDGTDTTIYIPAYSYNFMYYASEADIRAKVDVETSAVTGDPNFNAAVHITSNVGITGYYIYDWYQQQETFMLKGTASLGTQFTVTSGRSGNVLSSVNGQSFGSAMGPYIGVLGTEDGTTVNFTIPNACFGYTAGSHTVTLNKGNVLYLCATASNLAGSIITSDKPITITEGDGVRNSGGPLGSGGSGDHIGDQLVTDAFAGNVYVMPLSGGFNSSSDNYVRMNSYFEMISIEDNTTVQIDWGDGAGLVPLATLANAGNTYTSDSFHVTRPYSCATIMSDKPIHIMQNTGHEATLCHVPNFYGTNTHQASFYSYHEAYFNIYPAISLVYLEASKEDYTISYPGQAETPLFDWVAAKARWIDGQGDVAQFPGWKYIRLTLPDEAINQIITIKSTSSVF